MTTFRRVLLFAGILCMLVLMVACGTPAINGGNTGNANNNANNAKTMGTATPTISGTAIVATPTTQPIATTVPTTIPAMQNTNNMNALIHTRQVTLNGKMVTVLTTAKGLSLYYRVGDPAPNSACTGTCTKIWPPLVVQNNMMNVTSSMQLPKKLTIFKTANGFQIEYDGHPLYTYSGDMTPGQFNGRGMGNTWYLVATNF